MKRILVIALGLVFAFQVFGQKDDDEKTTKNSKPLARLDQADRIQVDLFTDIWLNKPDIGVWAINRGCNIFLFRDVPIGKSNFSFAAGAGISWHNMWSDAMPVSEMKLISDTSATDDPASWASTGKTVFEKIPASVETMMGGTSVTTTVQQKNNKLTMTYIDIPIEFRFRTKNEGWKFKFALGFKAGYLISSHTKYRGTDIRHDYTATGGWALNADNIVKVKSYKVPNLETYRLGPTLRIGWGWINVSVFYSLTDLFKKDKGPEMSPLSIGLSITPL